MALIKPITFVVTVNDTEILWANLLASPFLSNTHPHQILAQKGFASAATAYNEGVIRAANDLIVLAHQDVFFPATWLIELERALEYLERADPNWGVLGCWGVTREGQTWGHVYSTGWGILGKRFACPMRVETLDEFVLILRKSSGLVFDERLPHFHLYGTDICLAAARRGLKCYAISAFCIHNTDQILELPCEFYQCYRHIKCTWKEALPIQTSCIRISQFDSEVWLRRFKAFAHRVLGATPDPVRRAKDPRRIFEELHAVGVLPAVPAR